MDPSKAMAEATSKEELYADSIDKIMSLNMIVTALLLRMRSRTANITREELRDIETQGVLWDNTPRNGKSHFHTIIYPKAYELAALLARKLSKPKRRKKKPAQPMLDPAIDTIIKNRLKDLLDS
jgi:hypothetical protein